MIVVLWVGTGSVCEKRTWDWHSRTRAEVCREREASHVFAYLESVQGLALTIHCSSFSGLITLILDIKTG